MLKQHRAIVSTAAAVLLAGLVLAGAAHAGPNNKGSGKRAQGPYAAQVAELRSVNRLLARADHDYNGHRVKAMKHIHAAVAALRPNNGNRGHGSRPGRGGNERQSLSDAQLRKAIQRLRTVETQLATTVNPSTNKAVASIRAAIKELEIALTIR